MQLRASNTTYAAKSGQGTADKRNSERRATIETAAGTEDDSNTLETAGNDAARRREEHLDEEGPSGALR